MINWILRKFGLSSVGKPIEIFRVEKVAGLCLIIYYFPKLDFCRLRVKSNMAGYNASEINEMNYLVSILNNEVQKSRDLSEVDLVMRLRSIANGKENKDRG